MASLNPDRSEWDVIVVGGAAAGENAAQYATQFSGLEAVIVEKELVGGECSYWACMPSKSLLRPVEMLSAARDLPGVKELLNGRRMDAAAVLARRDTVVNHLDDASQVKWALDTGIDVIRGAGRLTGERTVAVRGADGAERTITARHAVVLDTGSSPLIADVPGLREARPWTSRDVTNIHEIPDRVVVVGGGVVACEAVTWLHGLGVAELTIVGRAPGLLGRNEPFAGDLVQAGFAEAGVTVLLGEQVTRVERAHVNAAGIGLVHGGPVTVTLGGGGVLTADEIVVATGRVPNSTGIGLESVGLEGGGPVHVDDHLTVEGVPGEWLYAIGDLCGRALLTHVAKYQARIAGEVIAARAAGRPLDDAPFNPYTDIVHPGHVPQVTFTDPEIGSVGITEAQARDSGLEVETVEYDLAQLAGTYVLRDHYVGRAKLVIDSRADVLLGVTFVGTGVAELTHSATMAVLARIPIPVLRHVVPSYPTISEVWLRLLESLNSTRRRSPSVST
ncbi:dihydrolipoyl dehydrogenase family protein [Actinomadura scrupuli]|uniref:dihydrolipoyl dehydrogenase family protein n=1 Tax=Actinomadura scrupuli TaxID=559629 RepID=UPI003D957987